MWRLLKIELQRMFRSKALYALLFLMVGYSGLILLGFEGLFGSLEGDTGKLRTGSMFLFTGLSLSYWPLVASMAVAIAGASISQDIKAGTMRYVLITPVSRMEFLIAKFLTVTITLWIMLTFLFLILLALGYGLYGPGRVLTDYPIPRAMLEDGNFRPAAFLLEQEALRRCILFVPLATFSALSIAALALLVSSLTDSPVIAIGFPLGVVFIAWIIQFSPFLDWMKPWLFTRELYLWDWLFAMEVPWRRVGEGALRNAVWIGIFFGITSVVFCVRDVKS